MKRLYVVAIILGAILTPKAHAIATAQRGYTAVGGEFLIIPLLLIITMVAGQIKDRVDETNRVFREREERKRWREKEKAQSTTRC